MGEVVRFHAHSLQLELPGPFARFSQRGSPADDHFGPSDLVRRLLRVTAICIKDNSGSFPSSQEQKHSGASDKAAQVMDVRQMGNQQAIDSFTTEAGRQLILPDLVVHSGPPSLIVSGVREDEEAPVSSPSHNKKAPGIHRGRRKIQRLSLNDLRSDKEDEFRS